MKVSTITRTTEIDNATLLNLFVEAVYGDAKDSTGKSRTLYRALGYLVGVSDADAVERANNGLEKEYCVTVTEFRKWLPTVFAEFARVMLEKREEETG